MNWADVVWPKLLIAKSISAWAWLVSHWSFLCFTIEPVKKHLIHTSLLSDLEHCGHICHPSRVMLTWLVTISEWHIKYLQRKQKKGLELKFLSFCMCIYAFTHVSVCHRLCRSQKTKSEGTLSSHGISRCGTKVTKLGGVFTLGATCLALNYVWKWGSALHLCPSVAFVTSVNQIGL